MEALQHIDLIVDSFGCCVYAQIGFAIFVVSSIRDILDALFSLHRSKRSAKEIKKQYTLLERLALKHIVRHGLHARRFCCILIAVHHISILLLMGVVPISICSIYVPMLRILFAWVTVIYFFAILIPVAICDTVLNKFPFRRGKRIWRFEKYHHSNEYNKLF